MEKGKISPKINRIPALAEALGCSVADLFRFNDQSDKEATVMIEEMLSSLDQGQQKVLIGILPELVSLIRK